MADIAMVFHWGPEELAAMSLEDLSFWREKARIRHEGKSK